MPRRRSPSPGYVDHHRKRRHDSRSYDYGYEKRRRNHSRDRSATPDRHVRHHRDSDSYSPHRNSYHSRHRHHKRRRHRRSYRHHHKSTYSSASSRHYITDPENTDHRDLFDLVWCMLKYCPKERITLREAFRHPFFAKYQATEEDGGSHAGNQDRERSHSISR